MLAWVSQSDAGEWQWWPGSSGECPPVRFRWTPGYDPAELPDAATGPFLTWVALADERPRWRGSHRGYGAALEFTSVAPLSEREHQLWDSAPWTVGAAPVAAESVGDGDLVWAYVVHSSGIPVVPPLYSLEPPRSELTRVVFEQDALVAPGERPADGWVAVRRRSVEARRVLRRNCGAVAGGTVVNVWTLVAGAGDDTGVLHASEEDE